MENQIIKKKWNKESLCALMSLVAALAVPYPAIEIWLFIIAKIDKILYIRFYEETLHWVRTAEETGYIGPYPSRYSLYWAEDFIFTFTPVLVVGLLGFALYFAWRAKKRTQSGEEKGWLLAILIMIVSGFFLAVLIPGLLLPLGSGWWSTFGII